MNTLQCLLAAAVVASPSSAFASANGSYSFYPSAVEGSARTVGMGGATVVTPRDYSAAFVNPAGLGGMTGDGVDVGSDGNHIDNIVFDPDNPTARELDDPIDYSFYGARYVSKEGGWGLAFSRAVPYKLDSIFNGTQKISRRFRCGRRVCTSVTGIGDSTELTAESDIYTLAGAKSFLDKRLSLGIALNYIQVSEGYVFTPVVTGGLPNINLQATNDAFSADVGGLYEPVKWFRLGAVYKMGYRVPFEPSRNDDALGATGPVNAFRDGKAPDRVVAGVGWIPKWWFGLYAQTTYAMGMKDTVVVGSNLFPGGGNVQGINQHDTTDWHWGFELKPIDEPDLTIKFYAGGYYEETGIAGGYNRYHRTAGFSFQPWSVSLSAAVDDTEKYNNAVIGIGVDLLEASDRIAKMFGWKFNIQ